MDLTELYVNIPFTLYLHNTHSNEVNEVVVFDEESDLRTVKTAIEDFYKERNYEIPYVRISNEKKNEMTVTVFDVGCRSDYLFLYPPINIEELSNEDI